MSCKVLKSHIKCITAFFYLDFYPGQTKLLTFTEFNGKSHQQIFNAKEDAIFEPGQEVFEVVMKTNESLVEISPNSSVKRIIILDDEGKNNISFRTMKILKKYSELLFCNVELYV